MQTKEAIITQAEEKFMHYKLGILGSGLTALIDAIWKLDMPNRAKIAKGFPELVEVCNRYNIEDGYWQDLQARWKAQGYRLQEDL